MALIQIKVDGHKAEKLREDWLATGSQGVDSVEVEVSTDWAQYEQSVVFKCEDTTYFGVVQDGAAVIPAAVLEYRFVLVGLLGTLTGGDVYRKYTTNFVPIRPREGAGGDGTVPPEPSASLYAQILGIAESAESKAQSVVDRADAGDFDGDPGPQGEQGEPGPQGEPGEPGPQGEPGEVTNASLATALLSKADVITDSVSGTTASVTDASNMPLASLNVYGQTMQNGTPTPTVPVAIVSATPTVTITNGTDTQTVTTVGLNGLMSSNATYTTYTDSTSQAWYADTLDCAAGKIYRRVGVVTFDGSESWVYNSTNAVAYLDNAVDATASSLYLFPLCDRLIRSSNSGVNVSDGEFSVASNGRLNFKISGLTSKQAYIDWLGSNNITVCYALATPVEEDIPSATLSALQALHTYKPNTTISVDTWMSAEYRCDTKAYIDNKITQAVLALT